MPRKKSKDPISREGRQERALVSGPRKRTAPSAFPSTTDPDAPVRLGSEGQITNSAAPGPLRVVDGARGG